MYNYPVYSAVSTPVYIQQPAPWALTRQEFVLKFVSDKFSRGGPTAKELCAMAHEIYSSAQQEGFSK